MKGKMLSLQEVMNFEKPTKVWFDGLRAFNEVLIIDKPYIKDTNGRILMFLSSIIDDDSIYEWIEDKIESKQYYGDEILKMIREGKLKEGDKYIRLEYQNKSGNDILSEMIFRVGLNESSPSFSSLIKHKFTIKEKEYFTFDEARKSGKNFKYKDWNTYMPISDVLFTLYETYPDWEIDKMLDENLWEVED